MFAMDHDLEALALGELDDLMEEHAHAALQHQPPGGWPTEQPWGNSFHQTNNAIESNAQNSPSSLVSISSDGPATVPKEATIKHGTTKQQQQYVRIGSLAAAHAAGPDSPQAGSPTLASAASIQMQLGSPGVMQPRPPPPSQHQQAAVQTRGSAKLQLQHTQSAAEPSPGASGIDDVDEFDAISRPPVASHSSVEKQRRDRLNGLIEKLATIVPALDASGQPASPTGNSRRAKHVVLADTIRMLRKLQDHMHSCPHADTPSGATHTAHNTHGGAGAVPPPPPMPPPPPSRAGSLPSLLSPAQAPAHEPPPGTARSQAPPTGTAAALGASGHPSLGFAAGSGGGSGSGAPLDMPLPLDIPATATGVMVEAPLGCSTWRLRVTCRDRPGLLADVAVALRALPVSVAHASVTTTPEGKAQQVFEVSVLDASLAPEEVQCAINAALYAHLLPNSTTTAGPPAMAQAHTSTHHPNAHAPVHQQPRFQQQQQVQQQHMQQVQGTAVGHYHFHQGPEYMGHHHHQGMGMPAGKRPRVA